MLLKAISGIVSPRPLRLRYQRHPLREDRGAIPRHAPSNGLHFTLKIDGSKDALASLMKHAGTGKKVRDAIQANMARDPDGNPFD